MTKIEAIKLFEEKEVRGTMNRKNGTFRLLIF